MSIRVEESRWGGGGGAVHRAGGGKYWEPAVALGVTYKTTERSCFVP